MKRKCSIKGCNEVHHANGYCRKHEMRFRRTGTTELSITRAGQTKAKKAAMQDITNECRVNKRFSRNYIYVQYLVMKLPKLDIIQIP